MKKLIVLGFAALVGFFASNAPADNLEMTETKAPQVVGLDLVTPHSTGGQIAFALSVDNPNQKTLPGAQLTFFAPGTGLDTKTVDLPKGVTKIAFADPNGPVCVSKDYIGAYGLGQGPHAMAKLRVTPACVFGAHFDDPWNYQSPDTVQALEQHSIYIANVTLAAEPTCAAPLQLKIAIANHSGQATAGLAVTLLDQNGKAIGASTGLSVGSSLTTTIATTTMPTGISKLRLAGGANHQIQDRPITVEVGASCTLSTTKL